MTVKRNYQIMIAVGAAKGCGLYEVWSESVSKPVEFQHMGYFQTRVEAQDWIERRVESDCPSNSGQLQTVFDTTMKPCGHVAPLDRRQWCPICERKRQGHSI